MVRSFSSIRVKTAHTGGNLGRKYLGGAKCPEQTHSQTSFRAHLKRQLYLGIHLNLHSPHTAAIDRACEMIHVLLYRKQL